MSTSVPDKAGISVFFPFESAFPEQTPSIDLLINIMRRVDKWHGLRLLSRILWQLLTDSNRSPSETQRSLVAEVFDQETYDRLTSFARTNPNTDITVFFRSQLLEAIRWLMLLGATSCDPAGAGEPRKQDLLAAILLAGQYWGSRLERTFPADAYVTKDLEKSRSMAALSSRAGVNPTTAAWHPLAPIGRATRLFKGLLPKHFPGFCDLFHESIGVPYSFFLSMQVVFWMLILSRQDRNPLVTLDETTAKFLREAALRYLSVQAQTIDQFCADLTKQPMDPCSPWSLRPLRERPIIAQTQAMTVCVIPDPIVFVDSMTSEPIFSFGSPELRQQALASFGRAFEDYICEILQNAYPDNPLGGRVGCKTQILERGHPAGEVDAYIDYGHSIIIFEAKASFLPERCVGPLGPEDFLSELERRYVGTEDGHPKGATQLSLAIKGLAAGQWTALGSTSPARTTIYPTLVVNDQQMDDALALHHLCGAFQREFDVNQHSVVEHFVYRSLLVKNLIIITVADLEALEPGLDRFSLLDVLTSYSREHPDRLMSFHNFLTWSDYSRQMLPNMRLNRIAEQAAMEAKEMLGVRA